MSCAVSKLCYGHLILRACVLQSAVVGHVLALSSASSAEHGQVTHSEPRGAGRRVHTNEMIRGVSARCSVWLQL